MLKASKILTRIYIILYVIILALFTFQNFIILYPYDSNNDPIKNCKAFTLKNKLDKELILNVYDRKSKEDVIFFHGLGVRKSEIRCLIENRYKNKNLIFIMNRGTQEGQIMSNGKLINADLEAIVNDFLLDRYKSLKNELSIQGHSFGTFLALRCASLCKKKNMNFKITLFDPFLSVSSVAWEKLKILRCLLAYDFDSSKFFIKNKENTKVYFSEVENVLPEEEVVNVKKLLTENNIDFEVVPGVNHRNILFLHNE